jgi:hypothetical protein
MDPYLEHPHFWPGLHTSLIVYFRDQLQPLLQPRYIASIEERVFVERGEQYRVPDVLIKRRRRRGAVAVLESDEPVVVKVGGLEIPQRYIEILDRETGLSVVTVIELVSPSNKYRGAGRKSYLTKQRQVLGSKSHLVEIDLLRTGSHVMAVPEPVARAHGNYDYLTSVNRVGEDRDEFDLYPRTLHQRLPRVRVPLSGPDAPATLDIQEALEEAYDRGAYDDQINYAKPCKPPLRPADQAWANQLIRRALNGNGRNGKRKNKT